VVVPLLSVTLSRMPLQLYDLPFDMLEMIGEFYDLAQREEGCTRPTVLNLADSLEFWSQYRPSVSGCSVRGASSVCMDACMNVCRVSPPGRPKTPSPNPLCVQCLVQPFSVSLPEPQFKFSHAKRKTISRHSVSTASGSACSSTSKTTRSKSGSGTRSFGRVTHNII
jgi:hypothetical protein